MPKQADNAKDWAYLARKGILMKIDQLENIVNVDIFFLGLKK